MLMHFRLPRRFTEEDHYRIHRDSEKLYTLRLVDWTYVDTDTDHLCLPHEFRDKTDAFTETPEDHPVIVVDMDAWPAFGLFLEAVVGSQCPCVTQIDLARVPFDLPPEDAVEYDLPAEDAE